MTAVRLSGRWVLVALSEKPPAGRGRCGPSVNEAPCNWRSEGDLGRRTPAVVLEPPSGGGACYGPRRRGRRVSRGGPNVEYIY